MSTDPAREEAWNCNRCRDRRLIVWNGVATPCDRCAGALPERVIKELRLVSWGPSSDGLGRLAEVGSLPLQGTEANEHGGAGAGSVGGPSHDKGLCAECNFGPACVHFGASLVCLTCKDELVEADELCSLCGFGSEQAELVRSEHSREFPCNPCLWAYGPHIVGCKGGPDCLCEPEGL